MYLCTNRLQFLYQMLQFQAFLDFFKTAFQTFGHALFLTVIVYHEFGGHVISGTGFVPNVREPDPVI